MDYCSRSQVFVSGLLVHVDGYMLYKKAAGYSTGTNVTAS